MSQFKKHPLPLWRAILAATAIALAFGWLGHWVGYLWPAISLGLLIILIATWLRQRHFYHWLDNPERDAIPENNSAWKHIYSRLFQQYRKLQHTERAYKKFLVQYRRTMAALSDGVIFLDQDDRIQWFNDAAKQLLELDEQRDTTQRIERLIRHADIAVFLQSTEVNPTLEVVLPHNEDLHLLFSLLHYGSKERYLLIRDISEQKRNEQVRQNFVANASHELRTPLTVIRGYAEVLTDDYELNTTEYEAFTAINQQAIRMQRILDDMLHLARLESPTKDDTDDILNMDILLASAMTDSAVLAEQYEQTLHVEAAAIPCLRGNPMDIRSVIENLLANAIRYAGKGSVIRMHWLSYSDTAELIVEDNGVGIAEKHLRRLTERFYRVDDNRDSQTGGTGLGLAIVKHVLEKHQSQLLIDSVEDQGTTFRCKFPKSRLVFSEHSRPLNHDVTSVTNQLR